MRGAVRAALAGLILAGCGSVGLVPPHGIDELDLEPRPGVLPPGHPPATGPVVEVVRGGIDGEFFSVTVNSSGDGACIWMEHGVSQGGGCGALPGQGVAAGGAFGLISTTDGGDGLGVMGLVASEVAAVAVESSTGQRVGAVLVPLDVAELDAQLFLGFLPVGAELGSVVAFDDDGEVLEPFDLAPPPGGGREPGIPPTPEPAPS